MNGYQSLELETWNEKRQYSNARLMFFFIIIIVLVTLPPFLLKSISVAVNNNPLHQFNSGDNLKETAEPFNVSCIL